MLGDGGRSVLMEVDIQVLTFDQLMLPFSKSSVTGLEHCDQGLAVTGSLQDCQARKRH